MSEAKVVADDAQERPADRTGALIVVIFALQFLVALDMSLVNIALPSIRADLGFSASGLQWVVTAYLLTFAGLLLLGGRLGDHWGRRITILGGLVVFALASLAGGLATSPGTLIAARAIQGCAAALLAPASLALVSTIGNTQARTKAMGLWGAAGAAGGAAGVVLSGVLTDWLGWRAVLFVNIPIVAIAMAAALGGVPASRHATRGSLDVAGAFTVTLGVAAIVYGVTAATDHGWTSAQTVIGIVAGLALLVVFIVIERRVEHPLMPLEILRTRRVLGANIFGFMLAAGQLAAFYFCSLYVQTVWDVDPDIAGVLFLPFCFFVVVGIIVANKLRPRIGARNAIVVLGLFGAIGLGVFALMPADFDFFLGILLPSCLAAIGIGGSLVLVGAVSTEGVEPAHAGAVSGVVNSARQLGGTIGLAVLVTIAAQFTSARDGYHAGFAVGAVLLVVGSLAAWLILPRGRQM